MKSLGIDLAGKEKNPSGVALLNQKVTVKELYNDSDILNFVEKTKPTIISIDSPFSIPQGYWRSSDLQLKEAGFKPLSPKFPTMQMLTRRAMKLLAVLRKKYHVIEVFPRATEKILCADKTTFESKYNLELSDHEYDAILCAITGKLHLEGKTKTFGSDDENDQIVIPRL